MSEKLFIQGWSPKDARDCLRQAGLHMADLNRHIDQSCYNSVTTCVQSVLMCLGAAVELGLQKEPSPEYTTKDAYRNGYRHGMEKALNLMDNHLHYSFGLTEGDPVDLLRRAKEHVAEDLLEFLKDD